MMVVVLNYMVVSKKNIVGFVVGICVFYGQVIIVIVMVIVKCNLWLMINVYGWCLVMIVRLYLVVVSMNRLVII